MDTPNIKTVEDYLKLPYLRAVLADGERGWSAKVMEFPGCHASGATKEEALQNIEEAAKEWIECELEQEHQIPLPWESQEFSGRTVLRMPPSLHRSLSMSAAREGTSLNQYIVTQLSTKQATKEIAGELTEQITTLMRAVSNKTDTIVLPAWKRRNVISETKKTISIPFYGGAYAASR